MKIKKGLPWIWFVLNFFHPTPREDCIIGFGDTIYSNVDLELYPHKMAHEEEHLKSQHYSKIIGLAKILFYCVNEKYRLKEEMKAYQAEWEFVKKTVPKREQWRFKNAIAKDLSGDGYGRMISYQEAIKKFQ